MSSGFKSIKFIEFDGEEEDSFREWRSKSQAIGHANGWWDQVEDDSKAVLKIPKTTTNIDEIEILKNEKAAKMYFTLACQKKAFQFIVDVDTA